MNNHLARLFKISVVTLLLTVLSAPAIAQTTPKTIRVSTSSSNEEANGHSLYTAISGDGTKVAFASTATNLLPADTDTNYDIYVKDLTTNELTLASVSSNGIKDNGGTAFPGLSYDGRYVAFYSGGNSLVISDTNGTFDIFVRDTVSGTTTLVSKTPNGNSGNGLSFSPHISGDGRYITYYSEASNLVMTDTNGSQNDVFVYDQQTGQNQLVSVSSSGVQGVIDSKWPSISADGRYVAFTSLSNNLVPNDTSGYDIYVRDLQTGTTTRVNVSSTGQQANNGSESITSLSADGRYVVFSSSASNLVANDTNGRSDVFRHDRVTGTTVLVSKPNGGGVSNGHSGSADISADGQRVIFLSDATNLVSTATLSQTGVFLFDFSLNRTFLASATISDTQANAGSGVAQISGTGRWAIFESDATNLVEGDIAGFRDIFVRDLGIFNKVFLPIITR